MQSKRELIAHQSVVDLHRWIEEVFAGRSDYPAALNHLLGSFSPSFKMVTMKGQSIGFAEVENLFRNNTGDRPNLQIDIDSFETLQLSDSSVICRYRETHRNEGNVHSRWSVAVIDIQNEQPRWHYLHETAIVD
ncbi:hypothetical protein Q0A17_13560 [Citrobacter sp. S2-9]|uniref:DUF4440 domain-containing protein n=1 Tax=Citrobacter enshiensis TaxID=2971264 RepID=A0ABT8PVY9_9ENTR|nr:hypothetical protein [Citrobacter enshiensis]MDN8600429.1 hypothetical protein [Citrobacter enshiensis]